jgi:predicted RNase H-like HicB family nuclease
MNDKVFELRIFGMTVIIEKGKNYSAFSPDVLGCVATGSTIEETIKNMKEALLFHKDKLYVCGKRK